MQLPIDFIRSILTAASLSHQFSVSSTDSDGTRWTADRAKESTMMRVTRVLSDDTVCQWGFADMWHFNSWCNFHCPENLNAARGRTMQGPVVAELLADAKANAAAAREMLKETTAMREADSVATKQRERRTFQQLTGKKPVTTIEHIRAAVFAIGSVLCDPEGNACFEGGDGDRAAIEDAFGHLKNADILAGATVAELEREAAQMRARMERLERENAELVAQRDELHNAIESTTHDGAMSTVVQLLRTAASWAELVAQRDELWKELGATGHPAASVGVKSLRARADMLAELHAVVQMQNRAASSVLGVPSDLAKFYDAPTWPQLVEAQAKHIESLQKRVQYGAGGQVFYGSGAPQQVREG